MHRISLFAALAGMAFIASAEAAPPPIVAGTNATILRDGRPYRAVGINFFDCFLRPLKNGEDTSYDEGFRTLAEYHIPFARFCATGFWPSDMGLYRTNRTEYFRRLDGVVKSAESHGVGLIPSLFWNFACVPDLCGEPMDQWGNPESRTHAWMREYVGEVVARYRDARAIWAWELGNEFSLQASLPNAKEHRPAIHPTLGTATARTGRDEPTYAMVRVAFAEFAKVVRRHDPHRLIVTGDSFPRLSAWHQEHGNTWKTDTKEQFQEMLERANPDPVSGISLHAYEDDDRRLPWAVEVARRMNKPLFVGEFGAQGTTPEQAAKFRRLLAAIDTNDVALAAVWVFDLKSQKDFTILPGTPRAYQLEAIRDWNLRLR